MAAVIAQPYLPHDPGFPGDADLVRRVRHLVDRMTALHPRVLGAMCPNPQDRHRLPPAGYRAAHRPVKLGIMIQAATCDDRAAVARLLHELHGDAAVGTRCHLCNSTPPPLWNVSTTRSSASSWQPRSATELRATRPSRSSSSPRTAIQGSRHHASRCRARMGTGTRLHRRIRLRHRPIRPRLLRLHRLPGLHRTLDVHITGQ